VKLHGLATWRDVLDVASATGRLDAKAQASVVAFLEDPEGWSNAHGGKVANS
jgi:orotate phosphoribosyltransferase